MRRRAVNTCPSSCQIQAKRNQSRTASEQSLVDEPLKQLRAIDKVWSLLHSFKFHAWAPTGAEMWLLV